MAMTGGTAVLLKQTTPSGFPTNAVKLYAYYKYTQDAGTNKTTMLLGMYVTTPSGWDIGKWDDSYGSYIGDTSNTFNGTMANFSGTKWLTENQEFVVTHDDEGKATATIKWKWGVYTTWGGFVKPSGSFTVDLPQIARASTIDSLACATNYFNGTLTYKYTPKSSNYYNRCNISLNLDGEYIAVKSINLGKKAASQQTATVTLSSDELSTIYDELPNTTKGTLRFTFRTYSDSGYSNQIGSAGYKEISLNIPDNSSTKPTVAMTLSPVNTVSGFDGLYIQGKSKVKAALSAKGKNNASIKSYSMSAEGKTYDSGDSYTSGYLNNSGTVNVTGYAKDSRGFTGSNTQPITILAYSKPKILPISAESEVIAARCDASGVFTDSGTYIKIMARRSYSNLTANGAQNNFCQIRYRYKMETASSFSSWTTILASDSLASDEIVTGALLNGALLPTNTYIVQVGVIDDIGETAYTTITVPTDKVYWHRDGKRRSLAFGGYVEEDNTFSIAEDIVFKVKNKGADATVVSDTGWVSLGLSDSVIERENSAGRIGKGCYYRVINENHVYVAFCCQFSLTDNTTVTISKDLIPAEFRPQCYIYQLCIADNRAVARCKVTNGGKVEVDWVQVLSSDTVTSSYEVSWIDGYIDYWITNR